MDDFPARSQLDRAGCLDCRPEGPLLPLYRFDCLPSTNAIVWELLAAGAMVPFAAIARRQSAGRGQWGRTWQSEPGGLYLSVLMAAPMVSGREAAAGLHLTLAAAWGIATQLRAAAVPVSLKWPNDLVIAGRKLGGILCQQRTRGRQPRPEIAVGVGINWDNPVPPVAIALKPFLDRRTEAASIGSDEQLLQLVLRGLFRGSDRYRRTGTELLAHSYPKLLTSQGRTVTIGGREGTVVGVAPDGCLRLYFPDTGEERLQVPGTVSLGYPSYENPSL